jgi:hypothetical protein
MCLSSGLNHHRDGSWCSEAAHCLQVVVKQTHEALMIQEHNTAESHHV